MGGRVTRSETYAHTMEVPMRRTLAVLVTVLLALGSTVAGPAVTLPGPADAGSSPSTLATAVENESNESAPTGGLVSSVVGMEESTVDASVTIARFETRLAAASSDEARADVVATALNDSRMQVAMLEMRLETLRERRANGSISEGWFAVETAWLLSTAEEQAQVLARLNRAARSVPREPLADRNATVQHVVRLRQRLDPLLEVEEPDVHRTTFDRAFYRQFPEFAQRFNDSADSTTDGPIEEHLAGERVDLHVESDTGSPVVLSVRMTDDARIVDIRAGQRSDATVRATLDEATARRLVTAENPRTVLSEAIRNDEVTIQQLSS